MHTKTVPSAQSGPKEQSSFSAPLDSITDAHLEITSGISNLDLGADSPTPGLFQAQFTGLIPEVRVRKGIVAVHYRLSLTEWFKHALLWNRHAATITLNTSVPWQIDLHGGVSNIKADLKALDLKSLVFKGGVSQADISLPRPSGTIEIYVMGGSNRLSFSCMQRVNVRLRVNGGVSHLRFGEQSFGSVGERIELETPGYAETTDRYDIHVFSGANQLTVHMQE